MIVIDLNNESKPEINNNEKQNKESGQEKKEKGKIHQFFSSKELKKDKTEKR